MAGLRTGRFQSGRARGAAAGVITFALALVALSPIGGHAAATTFSGVYVSPSLGGGEPFVIYSHGAHDLIYSAHEGTTHIYNGQPVPAPQPGDVCDIKTATGFVCSYNNHVNDWYSTDNGATWTKSIDNPADTGFSDPSVTEDAADPVNNIAPLVYNTGINLVNDSLFATQDGGKTWLAGTPQCHEGDRPWLAGGKNGEVFMGTDSSITTHVVVKGTVTFDPITHTALNIACSTTSISDPNAVTGSSIGDQLYYDHSGGTFNGDLVEPARFNPGTSGCPSGTGICLGVSVLSNASSADFTSMTSTSHFTGHSDPFLTSFNDALGPRIIIGADDTIYMVWATDNPGTTNNGCGGNKTPLPNDVLMAYTKDEGVTWSATKTIAHLTTGLALWPWAAAGSAGNVSVVWYLANQATDPDCDSAHNVLSLPSTTWTVQIANIQGATTTATYPPAAINAIPNFDGLHPNGIFHVGAVCQNGTACAANTTPGNEDRRLGDYFTNALDANGCVMIATGDSQLRDAVTGAEFKTGRPLFLHQVSGPSLTTGLDCAAFAPNIPEAPAMTALLGAGALAIGAAVLVGRRRRLTSV